MSESAIMWTGFSLFIIGMLALDLKFHRKLQAVGILEALTWTGVWVLLAIIFNLFLYSYFDEPRAIEIQSGYLTQLALSMDVIFVIFMIFSYFHVPQAYQHKVLSWGIFGALVMRAILIFTGFGLIDKIHWLIYIFGVSLTFTGIRMLVSRDGKFRPEKNPLIKLSRKLFRVTTEFEGDNFFIRRDHKIWATPLVLVLVTIVAGDLTFASDSIPAAFAISNDAFILYTTNVFVIMVLRSLYFAIAAIERYFQFLKYGLSVIFVFIGLKMCITDLYYIPIKVSLIVILFTLVVSMIASVIIRKPEQNSR